MKFMNYLKVMDIKYIKIFALFLLLPMFNGCIPDIPGGEKLCTGMGGDVITNNLIIMTPLQATYLQGDIITVKINIPSKNNYFGSAQIDIFAQTQDYNGSLFITMFTDDSLSLFTGNSIEYVKGSIEGNKVGRFNMPYNVVNDSYEFEIKVKLNRLGSYSLPVTENVDRVYFQGTDSCNLFNIGTNITDGNSSGNIAFTVQ